MKCKFEFCNHNADDKRYHGFCQSCYRYFEVEGKMLYTPAGYGKINYAPNGDAICPICCKAFRKLGAHMYNGHNMTARESYKIFGWDYNVKASNKEYREYMKEVQDPKTISVNLIEKGADTRYEKGSKGRTRDQVSAMTMERLKQTQFIKVGNNND